MSTNFNIAKLIDVNPALATELRNHCYTIIGLCQQVHREMGPFLNEYMYQEALDISLEENGIERVKEYYFSVTFHGKQIRHCSKEYSRTYFFKLRQQLMFLPVDGIT